MIPFLDLKTINAQYREELIEACTSVIDSGWYIQGNASKPETELDWKADENFDSGIIIAITWYLNKYNSTIKAIE